MDSLLQHPNSSIATNQIKKHGSIYKKSSISSCNIPNQPITTCDKHITKKKKTIVALRYKIGELLCCW
jgi:hypothetical protein